MPARERRKRTHARPSQVAVARRKCTPVHACSLVVGWCECVFVSEYVCRRWLIAVVLVGAGRWSYRPASWPACTHNTVTSCVCLIAEPQWYTRVCVSFVSLCSTKKTTELAETIWDFLVVSVCAIAVQLHDTATWHCAVAKQENTETKSRN